MSLCKYKNIFGEENTGVHQYRIFDIAIIDVLCTIILAYIITKIYNFNFSNTLIIVFIIGILMHKLFCVRTTIDKVLFTH
jgi:hypothetical protein